ncbi:MAG: 30S ribosome-binding factor RbfA [Patescibacteria group bacterium]|nr:30S ribosome-binding factor RbfA [Patescibacteria group bacterium]
MDRIKKINSLLLQELAQLISREIALDNGLITVTFAECSNDLHQAKIGVSVLPENLTGTAIKKLKNNNALFSAFLKKRLNLKLIPKFIWVIDDRERRADKIEKIINSPKFRI